MQEGYDLGELGEDLQGAGEAIVAALTQQDDQRAIAEGAAGVMRRGAGEAERFGVRATAVDVEAKQLKEMLTYPSGWGPSEWGEWANQGSKPAGLYHCCCRLHTFISLPFRP
jgi:hypothetical protein